MVPYTDVLRQIRKGAVAAEATEALAELVRKVDATHRPGTLTITLTVAPSKDHSSEKSVSARISSKVPAAEIPPGFFFSTPDGDLLRDDPEQEEMFAEVGDRKSGSL